MIQGDFPVAEQPYEVLAGQLGCSSQEVLDAVTRLHGRGVIRRLGAIFDSRSLGYASTLVAGRIPPERLDEVAAIVSELPGVTHNYRREHARNLWFTLTARSDDELSKIIDEIRQRTAIPDFQSLPALTVYKIRVDFPLGSAGGQSDGSPAPEATGPSRELTEEQKQLVRLLQGDLGPAARPFDEPARQLGWEVRRVLEQIDTWRSCGVIRRVGAAVRHHRLGFVANGMAVFDVPPDRIDEAGRRLAERPEISHCYRRPSMEDFPYELFAMVHAKSVEEVRALETEVAEEMHVGNYDVLFSIAEYKKQSMQYFMEPPER